MCIVISASPGQSKCRRIGCEARVAELSRDLEATKEKAQLIAAEKEAAWQSREDDISSKLKSSRRHEEELEQEVAVALEKVSQVEENMNMEVTRVKQELAKEKDNVKRIKNQLKQLATAQNVEKAQASSKLRERRKSQAAVGDELDAVMAMVSGLKEQAHAGNESKKGLEKQLEETQRVYSALMGKFEEYRAESESNISEIEAQLARSENRASEMAREITGLQSQTETDSQNFEKERLKLRKLLDVMRDDREKAIERQRQLEKTNGVLDNRRAAAERALSDLREQHENFALENTTSMSKYKKQIEELTKKLENAMNESTGLKEAKVALAGELHVLRNSERDLQSKVDALMDTNSRLQNDLSRALRETEVLHHESSAEVSSLMHKNRELQMSLDASAEMEGRLRADYDSAKKAMKETQENAGQVQPPTATESLPAARPLFYYKITRPHTKRMKTFECTSGQVAGESDQFPPKLASPPVRLLEDPGLDDVPNRNSQLLLVPEISAKT